MWVLVWQEICNVGTCVIIFMLYWCYICFCMYTYVCPCVCIFKCNVLYMCSVMCVYVMCVISFVVQGGCGDMGCGEGLSSFS